MTDSTLPFELQKTSDEVLELDEELERMIEDIENLSVRLTWMTYDLVSLRTNPEMCATMQELAEEVLGCRAAVFGDQDPDQKTDREGQAELKTSELPNKNMENTEKHLEPNTSSANMDMEHILKELESLSDSLHQMAMETQRWQRDLMVCVFHPDKLARLHAPEAPQKLPQA